MADIALPIGPCFKLTGRSGAGVSVNAPMMRLGSPVCDCFGSGRPPTSSRGAPTDDISSANALLDSCLSPTLRSTH